MSRCYCETSSTAGRSKNAARYIAFTYTHRISQYSFLGKFSLSNLITDRVQTFNRLVVVKLCVNYVGRRNTKCKINVILCCKHGTRKVYVEAKFYGLLFHGTRYFVNYPTRQNLFPVMIELNHSIHLQKVCVYLCSDMSPFNCNIVNVFLKFGCLL